MVADQLSIIAYCDTEELRKTQSNEVYVAVMSIVDPCSSDIARYTGIPRTSVTARLKKLENDGMIEKGRVKKDPKTGKTVHTYRVKQWQRYTINRKRQDIANV